MNKFINLKKEKVILVGIVLLAAFLIFFRLTRADLQGDDSHFSFRSIGYIDYMSSQLQTTALQWLGGDQPLWTKFSFHDHPPLVFLVQHLFFKIFGISDFVAKLPFALAGLALILVVYLINRELFDIPAGLTAAFILAISGYHVWISRIGCLEDFTILFMALSLFFLLKSRRREEYFLLAGFFLGLGMLSKYTTLILVPVFIIYSFLYYKEVFKNKYFWFSFLVAIIIFLPVIFYNLEVYRTRGHFDVQFSEIFGQKTTDWTIFIKRHLFSGRNYIDQFFNIFKNIISFVSWPIFVFFLGSLGYMVWEAVKKNNERVTKSCLILLSLFFFSSVFFSLTNQGAHYLSPFNFMMALVMGRSLSVIGQRTVTSGNIYWRSFFGGLIALIVLFSLIYNFNTNHRLERLSGTFWTSGIRLESFGFQDLEIFLKNEFSEKRVKDFAMSYPSIKRFPKYQQAGDNREFVRSIYLYDNNTKWFPRLWYLERWAFYRYLPIFSIEQIKSIHEQLLVSNYQYDYLYFIKGNQPYQLDNPEYLNKCPEILADILETRTDVEVMEIKNKKQEVVFKVYRFKDLDLLGSCDKLTK